ncbi:MAG TPA: DUF1304 domain-containing protein [Devosia sp.]|nr:DUF1304 domain-containing protein [Devosia sp.]
MSIFAQVLIGIVALLHIWFLVLEMFLWEKPIGRKTFGLKPDFARQSRVLAANQGLYNGFLAAGLLWSLYPLGASDAAIPIATFFLACVIAAGLYGAATASRAILYIQALPALAALALVWLT